MLAAPLVAGCPAPLAGPAGAAAPALGGYTFSLVAVAAQAAAPTAMPPRPSPTATAGPLSPPPGVVVGGPAVIPGPSAGPARPTGGGSSGSGGGGSSGGAEVFVPGAPADVSGTVRAAYPDADGPLLVGARVRAIGLPTPVEAVTDEAGSFTLAGVPTGSALVVTAAGHVPAVVLGWETGPLELHLAAGSPLAGRFESFVPVEGDITLAGEPAAGAIVMGGNDVGTAFGPLVADENGHFAGHAISVEGAQATDLAAFAFLRAEGQPVAALGLTAGVTVGPEAEPVTIALRRPEGRTRLSVTEGPSGPRLGQVFARAANGFKVSIAAWGAAEPLGEAPFFRVDGSELVAQVEIESADGRARSVWRQVLTDLGDAAAVMLPFPAAPAITRAVIADGQAVTWPATAGASAYRLTLARGDDPKPLWEAYTPEPRLTFAGLPATATADRLEIVAMQGEGAGFRRIASLPDAPRPSPAEGPRRLRWLVPAALDRYATRTVPL